MKEIEYYFNKDKFIYKVTEDEYIECLSNCFAEMYKINKVNARNIIMDWLGLNEVEYQFKEQIKEYFKDEAYSEYIGGNHNAI